MKQKIILDVVPGITNILPLYYALFHPSLEVLGITVCGAGISLPASLRCVQRILDALQPPKLPRLGVGMSSLPALMGDLEAFYSSAFCSVMEIPGADYVSVHPACRILSDLIRENPYEITLITLGPLTNPARILGFHSELNTLLKKIIMVGGCVSEPGNATSGAEYNFYRDPESAARILGTEIPKTLLPLDVTNQLVLDYDILRILPLDDSLKSRFLKQALSRLFQLHRDLLGIEGIFAPGLLALQTLLHPEDFAGKMMYGEVETEGTITRGMTLFDRRLHPHCTPNMEVILEVEEQGVRKRIYDFLKNLKPVEC